MTPRLIPCFKIRLAMLAVASLVASASTVLPMDSPGSQRDQKKEQMQQLKKSVGDEAAMKQKVVDQPEFTVVGIAVRTSNAKEMTEEGQIGRSWERLFQESLLAKIPNKSDSSIVAVYTDYVSDKNGEYTYVLGARVNSTSEIPDGMVVKKIPAGRYAVFTTDKGPGPKVVPAAWMRINSLPKSAVGGDRLYRADFEIYDERATDPQSLQADIYVGIR